MKTVLVTGANGQLGTSIHHLSASYNHFQFLFTDVDSLDICKAESVDAFIQAHPVDYIVNCAAYTAVDKAEENPELCEQINRDAVVNLARAAQSCGAKVLHVSTDYVFDGTACVPYQETDTPHPQSALRREPAKPPCSTFVRMLLSYGRPGCIRNTGIISSRPCCASEPSGKRSGWYSTR